MEKLDKKMVYIELIFEWKKVIIYSTLLICVLVAIYSLLVTKEYEATAKILPPRQDNYSSLVGGISNLTSVFLGGQGGFSLPPLTSPSEVYKELLESRSLRQQLIEEFKLMEVHEHEVIEEALDHFDSNFGIEVTFAGFVNIVYVDIDTIRVKDLLDRALFLLDSINTQITINYHSNNRKYFESQLELIEKKLSVSEKEIKHFQEKHGVIEVTEQVKQLIEILTELEIKKMELVFQKGILDQNMNKDAFQSRLLQIQINNIQEEIDKVKSGTNENLSINVKEIPEISLLFADLLRQQKINETLNIFVRQQYEQAKFLEEKNTPTIMVLDRPQYPERRIYPKRRNMVLIALLFSMFLNIVFIIYKQKTNNFKSNHPVEYERINKLFKEHLIWRKKKRS